jgi:hypothetical protein
MTARALAAAVTLAVLGLAAPAAADEVDDLIQLVREQPADMDRTAWKEERREAARKLGQSRDARAVPVLIEVVETETFDVIAEIAIEALADIGDPRAVPVLQRIHADDQRDRYVRDMAATALRELGAEPGTGADPEPSTPPTPGTAGASGDLAGPTGPSPGPAFGEDVLAATERLTFALGSARLRYDTVSDRPSIDGDVRGTYERDVERDTRAIRYGVDAAAAAGLLDYPEPDSGSRVLAASALGHGRARFYTGGGPFFGQLEAASVVALNSTKIDRPGDDNDTSETMLNLDLHAGIGFGYGRVLEVGEAIRVARIEKVLRDARMLGRPITPDLAERLMRVWWTLRRELGYHQRLIATVKLLREAGVLLGEPDASTTYRILQVLQDGQLAQRPHGFVFWMAIGESYLVRDESLPVADGRIETVLARARYGHQQADGTRELVGEAFGRYRILAGDGDPTPWSTGVAGALRRYVYGDYADPVGALELRAELGASTDGADDDEIGTRVAGGVGWLWIPNRASRFRLSADLALESGALFVGASFEAAYGLLDVGYVGAGGIGLLGK